MLNAHVSFSIFMFVSAICLVILTVFIAKLVYSATQLTNNANVIASSVQKEIEPTLKELKEAAKSINSIAANADTQLQSTKAGIASLINATSSLSGKLKNFSTGILKGIAFGLGLFKK